LSESKGIQGFLHKNYMYLLTLILSFVIGLTIVSLIDGTFAHRIFFESHFVLGTKIPQISSNLA